MVKSEKKKKGVFYTNKEIAAIMVEKVFTDSTKRVLEPSFGEGSFLSAISAKIKINERKEILDKNIFGIEIREEPIFELRKHGFKNLICSDFLESDAFPVDIVIGNPPFVSIKNLPDKEKRAAEKVMKQFEYKMPANGSMWLPFILKSLSFLEDNGTLAFVLPFELTYVQYSKKLWEILCNSFSSIQLIRIFEDVFPEVDVEAIILIASGYGGKTQKIQYEIYESQNELVLNYPKKIVDLGLNEILEGKRPFVFHVLDQNAINIIERLRKEGDLRSIGYYCKFKIGYVAADKAFFHPSKEIISKYSLDPSDLIPAVADSKSLKKDIGIFLKKDQIENSLFYPVSVEIKPSAAKYIASGEEKKVNLKYKCRIRKPWYITPNLEFPDVILNVFGDNHRLIINEGKYAVSNSLLCGYLKAGVNERNIIYSWYNSITLLSIELGVHSLGGGVLVMIPGEIDKIPVINQSLFLRDDGRFIEEINKAVKENRINDAYLLGDEEIKNLNILTESDLKVIRESIAVLRKWRNAKLRKSISVRNNSSRCMSLSIYQRSQ